MARLFFDFYQDLLKDWSYKITINNNELDISLMFTNFLVIISILIIMLFVYKFIKWLFNSIFYDN